MDFPKMNRFKQDFIFLIFIYLTFENRMKY
jgi:hypothetical protein